MRSQVFISYSHKDKRWLDQLQVFLKPLERSGKVTRWDDTKIKAGQKWKDEIQAGLESARVAVLLISADFLASDFIAENELPPLLNAAVDGGAAILSVVISPCVLPASLSQYQTVNDPNRPLVDMSKGDRDRVWVKVVKSIEEAIASKGSSEQGKTDSADEGASASSSDQAPDKQRGTQSPPYAAGKLSSSAESTQDVERPDSISVAQDLELERVRAGDIAIAKGEDPGEMVAGAKSVDLAKNARIVDSEIGDIVAFKQTKQGKK
jgi:hypothetical protein